jgi:hypothetical protein
MTSILDRVKPYLIWPSLIGSYHVRALPFALGNAPTIGQTWYIFLFVILNIALTAGGYHSFQHPSNAWFPDVWQEIMAYVSARTGVLAFALAPLVVLLSGRNNVLLWLTDWSHSTYMLLHRWVARVFTLQVILHSILEFMLYKRQSKLDTEQKEPYWIWGIVATMACVIMVVVSSLWFRRKSYEIFLVMHIILAVFVIAGSWYHIELRRVRSVVLRPWCACRPHLEEWHAQGTSNSGYRRHCSHRHHGRTMGRQARKAYLRLLPYTQPASAMGESSLQHRSNGAPQVVQS